MQQVRRLVPILFTSTLFSLIIGLSVNAQQTKQSNPELNRARVNSFRNQVTIRFNDGRQIQVQRARVDAIRQRDALTTGTNSIATLLFDDRTLGRVDQNTRFTFRVGLRRLDLRRERVTPLTIATHSNVFAINDTIFMLESGAVLIASPSGSSGTQIETPEASINVAASIPLEQRLDMQAPESLSSLERTSAVMVVQGANTTQVFALTDGDITASAPWGGNEVSLLGGQTVAVSRGQFGDVQEFDLAAFYRSSRGSRLAAGLGPGQEDEAAEEESETVQQTLAAVRVRTLAAVRQQIPRLFVERALGGGVIDFYEERDTFRQTVVEGEYVRTGRRTFQFEPDDGTTPTNIQIDPDQQTIQINGQTGIDNSAGLSGNNASGTVVLPDRRSIRGEILNIDGTFEVGPPENPEPPIGTRRRGRLTTTIDRAPDR